MTDDQKKEIFSEGYECWFDKGGHAINPYSERSEQRKLWFKGYFQARGEEDAIGDHGSADLVSCVKPVDERPARFN